MTQRFKQLLLPAALMAFSTAALASPPNCLIDASCGVGSAQAGIPGLNNALITGTSIQTIQLNSSVFAARALSLGGGPLVLGQNTIKGIAAGGANPQSNAWGSFSKNTNEDTKAGQDFHTDVNNYVVGYDYLFSPAIVAGASLAIDSGDGDNNMLLGFGGNAFSTYGYSVAPYLGWQISNNLALDGTLGFGTGHLKSLGTTSTADRLFGGVNLTYGQWYGNWQLLGKAGYAYAEEKYGSAGGNPGVSNKLGQTRLGGQVSYLYPSGWSPYLGLTYVNDDAKPEAAPGVDWDDNTLVTVLGLNFFSAKNSVYGGVAYTDESRSHTKNSTLSFNIGLRF